MKTLPIIQSLWIGKRLSVMERLSISSFLKNGHPFHLYVYGAIEGIPDGVTIKDAREFLPPDQIFESFGSFAHFSDMFRYKMLFARGSYWVDTDIVCLKPFTHCTDYVFAAERRRKHHDPNIIVANCVMGVPSGAAILEYCDSEIAQMDLDTIGWGQTGPKLLMRAIEKHGLHSFIADPDVYCPIDWWNWEQFITDTPDDVFESEALKNAQAIHLWSQLWREHKVDKSGKFPDSSIYERLKKAYL